MSVGSITATNTPHQLAAGILDSPRDHFDDMPGFARDLASRDNPALRKLLTDNVSDTFRWLLSLGPGVLRANARTAASKAADAHHFA